MRTDYEVLIEAFLAGRLSVKEFETRFLKAFKNEPAGMNTEDFQVLDRLFSDVDSFSPNCREGHETEFEISEQALRRQAAKALQELHKQAA